MAGGIFAKPDPKKRHFNKNGNTSEVLQDSFGSYQSKPVESKPVFTLSGILGLNQSVEIGHPEKKPLQFVNHLEQSGKVLLDSRQRELQQQISQLQSEIQKLIAATQDLNQEVVAASLTPIVEISNYQLNFLDRLKQLIVNFRKNISSASIWLESVSNRKRKRNCYWSTFKNKKGGGEQYLFSGEHSAARSAT